MKSQRGGPAGLQAAQTAAERGARVVLFEALGHLGGKLADISAMPNQSEFGKLASYLLPVAIAALNGHQSTNGLQL